MTDTKNDNQDAPGITRRDFVGGTLLGTGTALHGMSLWPYAPPVHTSE